MLESSLIAARAYEEALVKTVFEPWAKRAVEIANPLSGEVVLDLACGTGIGMRLMSSLVGKSGKIISVDNDPAMISVAKELFADIDDDHKARVEWYDCGAEALILSPNQLDLCTLLQGPNFLQDPKKVLRDVLVALKPGGRVVGSAWAGIEENKGHFAIASALEKLGYQPALKPFSLGSPDTLRDVFMSSGFAIEKFYTEQKIISFNSVKEFVSGVAAGAPATRHAISQLDPNTYEKFFEMVEELLSKYSSTNGVSLPTQAHIVVAVSKA
jgi:ubiquinone/menaquinone biosynthesis C-methylase UbiE